MARGGGGGCLLTGVGWTGGFVVASMWWMLPFFIDHELVNIGWS